MYTARKGKGENMKYTLIASSGDIVAEGNNKALLIAECRKLPVRATVIDERIQWIIYENKIQRAVNNDKVVRI